jgi:hypothetical protein
LKLYLIAGGLFAKEVCFGVDGGREKGREGWLERIRPESVQYK